jgi:hypothetical protein
VCKVRRIKLHYTAVQIDKFYNIRDMILGPDAKDVITVRTEKKMKLKMRQFEGNGLPGRDTIVIVSRLEKKVYRILFRKSIRLDNLDSVAFGYIKLAELLHLSIFVINLCKFISQM